MPSPKHDRPRAFYTTFDRKGGDHGVTHYCPGCGHGNLHKFIAEAIDDFGIADRTIFVNPVGCSVFAYYYLDVGHVQAAHGRAPAVATAIKRARPESIVIAYQGDGDLAAIGGNEILHAANRGENITVVFVNNALYGMTGGQMAPTTLIGQKTTTTPLGRNPATEGYPIRVCELLNALQAPASLERVAIGDAKRDMAARKAVRKAIQNQIEGRGFSLVEVLSPCPTGWKTSSADSVKFVLESMTKDFPLGVVRDRTRERDAERPHEQPREARADRPIDLASALGLRPAADAGTLAPVAEEGDRGSVPAGAAPPEAAPPGAATPATTRFPGWSAANVAPPFRNPRIKAAGFGGQGALFLGALIAEAGMRAGRAVSWLPSYGPEMRGGTAHCHVILSDSDVDSPLVTRSTVLFALNGPSYDRFLPDLEDGGLVVYDSSLVHPAAPPGRSILAIGVPATTIAEGLGSPRAANVVALGAWIGRTGALPAEAIEAALRDHALKPEAVSLNMAALEAGMREGAGSEACEKMRVGSCA